MVLSLCWETLGGLEKFWNFYIRFFYIFYHSVFYKLLVFYILLEIIDLIGSYTHWNS